MASRIFAFLLFLFVAPSLHAAFKPGQHWLRIHDERALDTGLQVAFDPAGNVFHLWRSATSSLAKYDPVGNILWEQKLTNNRVRCLAIDRAGNAFVGGEITVTNTQGTRRDLYLAKIDGQTHEHRWQVTYTDPEGKEFNLVKIVIDPNGHPVTHSYLTPSSSSPPSASKLTDTFIARYDSTNRAQHWNYRYYGLSNNWSGLDPIAVGDNGDVAFGGSLNTNFFAAKLRASDGFPLWSAREGATTTSNSVYVTDVDIDSSGIVSIIGGEIERDLSKRMRFARFNATTGARLWQRTRTGPTNWNGYIEPIGGMHILSTTNNRIVTVSIEDQISQAAQVLIATYSATNRALLWEKRFGINSPRTFGCDEDTVGLAFDAKGNLLLAMWTPYYSTTRLDYSATLNIDINSGELLWELLHPGHAVTSMASRNDIFALSGTIIVDPTIRNLDAFAVAFGKVPELITTRQTDGAYLLRWADDYSGWALRSALLPLSSSPPQWTELAGSRNTNEFKLTNPSEPGRIYQLTR